jgi:hypothetical protein
MRSAALRLRVLALALALMVTTAACSDPRSDYCAAVEDHQKELSEILARGGPTALLEALPIFEDLAQQAPVDIRDEWDTVIDALQSLLTALEDAGVDPATYDSKHPPEGLTTDERDRIEAAADDVADPRTSAALAGVDQQARDVCKTPLSL